MDDWQRCRSRTYTELQQARHAQLDEARHVLTLAWDAGVFDDLDPQGSPAKSSLLRLVLDRAEELLQRRYPEVRVRVRPRSREGYMRRTTLGGASGATWDFKDDPRPRAVLEVGLRKPLTHLREVSRE